MGMSASQARLLSLQARQSNLEYQGQQINQERSVLSQQCTALYNSLLAMTVPTPPSTTDFTTIEYSGADGATTFTLGSIKPQGEAHIVEICTQATGDSLSVKYGTAAVSKAGETVKGTPVENSTITREPNDTYSVSANQQPVAGGTLMSKVATPEAGNFANYYVQDPTTGQFVRPSGEFDPAATYFEKSQATGEETLDPATQFVVEEGFNESVTPNQVTNLGDLYVLEADGSVRKATVNDLDVNPDGGYTYKAGVSYIEESPSGSEYTNKDAGATTIAGKVAMTFEEAKTNPNYKDLDWASYEQAIKNKFPDKEISGKNFMVYFTKSESGVIEPHFAFDDDVNSPDGRAVVYDYSPNGKYTESKIEEGCKLTFDVSGRITAIDIPVRDESTGEIQAYNTISLTATKITDDAAYQDAYAKYEYAQYEYDKKQQEINAKTEIIQQQDRNLELKLQRLDNERTQITTEIEAVEKVINENIESSYKTFSG